MAPKKKAQKMALADFFADAASGSWADEMDNVPTAPAARAEGTAPKRGEPGYLDSMPDRGARPTFTGGPPREELPLPDVPPFTAFIGNLVFEVEEDSLRDFFAEQSPTSVRLVKDPTGKPKGFGYVEFSKRDDLKAALEKNMQQMMGRTIRISVADAPAKREGYPGSAADGADQWRRTTPLPARADAPQAARRTSSFADRPEREGGPDLDWGSARGSRFVPSAPHSPLRRDSSGPGRERGGPGGAEYGQPSAADEAGQWRSSRPMAEPRQNRDGSTSAGRGGPGAGLHTGESSPSLAETEATWSRGSKLRTPIVDETPQSAATASPAEERDWRSSRATSAVPSADGGSPSQPPPAPVERRKLTLAPRSVPATPSTATTAATSGGDGSKDSRSSIFGSAKPIDSATKEREAEEKLAQKEEERRKAREEEIRRQKEDEEKGRLLQEEKAKKFKEEQAKATSAALAAHGLPPNPAGTDAQSERAAAGAGGGVGAGAQRRGGGPGGNAWQGQGPRRTSSGNVHDAQRDGSGPRRPSGPGGATGGPRRSSQDNVGRGGSGATSAGRQTARSPPAATVGEDGFEISRSKAKVEKKEAPKPVRKESQTRPGFSFAAAANSFGLLDEAGEEGGDEEKSEEKKEGAELNGKEQKDEIKEITNGVKEVSV
ncbi:hypothetical protein BD324DRAFT_635176 [Kockovaella imperatae]|uniref:RRM domain-containing protein n=1 Tax=Kockovaella imperatae TaxID=4999 RepID=A0A1Y1U9X0_9TREE|nr:hypothetical protein BD324DRAFT_635176 [Kockovaella imperatae]ORX34823.1 hypothetical protein BD324DRAFT_635176 [Kockovaella imperatae]